GHDQRTFSNPGFHNLVERGIRWAAGEDPQIALAFGDRPQMTAPRTDLAPFEFTPAKVPFYPPSEKWGTMAEPLQKMQKPLSPEESMKHFITPVGFEVQLFVSEPELQGKPIAMAWDERGRLWVAESVDYPNELQEPGNGRDRIRICEDTNNDGKADKFTVFAEKLSIPTSLAFCRGGVIVHQAPDTLFLRDVTGDDVADQREVMFTGWATNDTHAGPSNLNFGADGFYYGQVGYAGFRGEIAGEQQSFRTGFYRFLVEVPAGAEPNAVPKVTKFEFLRNTNNNSWGVGLSEEDVLFGSTANHNPSVYMPIANRFYEAVRGGTSSVLGSIAADAHIEPTTENIRQMDNHGSFTAAVGHALYTARAYPKEYWNRTSFVSEPTAHLTAVFTIQPDGADYHSKYGWNLLSSDDEWCAPTIAEVGPDGQVWVVDWYNYIVQHNPTPVGYKTGKGAAYETDLRDKTHGRIYRVVYRGDRPADSKELARSVTAPFSLAGGAKTDPAKLVAALKSDNLLWRRHAERLLIERGQLADVQKPLLALVADPSVDEIGLNVGAIHALYTLGALKAITPDNVEVVQVATNALSHKSAGVRRAALLTLPSTQETAKAIAQKSLLSDPDGQVRLAALLTISELPPCDEAAQLATQAILSDATLADRWLADAALCAAAAQGRGVLANLSAVRGGAQLKPKSAAIVTKIAEHIARGGAPEDALVLVGVLKTADPSVAAAVAQGLAQGWPKTKSPTMTPELETAIVAAVGNLPAGARSGFIGLASRWGAKEISKHTAETVKKLSETIADETADAEKRVVAANELMDLAPNDPASAKSILAAITPRTQPEASAGFVAAASKSEAPEVGPVLCEIAATATPAVKTLALKALLARTEWTKSLLAAAEKNQLSLSDVPLDARQALASHPDKGVADRAKKLLAAGGGLPNPDRQKVIDEFLPITKKTGDAVAGKLVFTQQCAKCHKHNGEGNAIGPDLSGMAVHTKEELLTHVLDPSRSVEGNYRVYSVELIDGRVLTGLLASESKTSFEIVDAEGKRHALLRDDVESLAASPKSLMPEGFEKQVKPEAVGDLLEFLTQRGKYLPLPMDKVATIVSTKGMFYDENADEQRLIFPDWKPKEFAGVPFRLIDPQDDRTPNVVMLNGPNGKFPPRMPKSVSLPCNSPAKAIHFLGGVSGWGFPFGQERSVSVIVRLHYADGSIEDHPLQNGVVFADYIRRVDVPGSKFAFAVRDQQVRYFSVEPKKTDAIASVELVKGPDATAPIIVAATVERP
ncbi:MAG TPA: PVC-type heme-binding CxxCH protein, partial [Pirellulales bacterium]